MYPNDLYIIISSARFNSAWFSAISTGFWAMTVRNIVTSYAAGAIEPPIAIRLF